MNITALTYPALGHPRLRRSRIVSTRRLAIAALAVAALLLSSQYVHASSRAENIMEASCTGCHSRNEDGSWVRISDQRKSPEGWHMTLVRMRAAHGAELVDPAGGDELQTVRRLVRYLSRTQGLAPEETAPFRYVLEREFNTIENHDTVLFGEMCARCHSGARVGLQRRSKEEWHHLVHFHLGQFPTTEYSLMGRDRDWLGIALEKMVPYLSERFPLDNASWDAWQKSPRPTLDGRWRVTGRMPGKGHFSGHMTATPDGDNLALQFSGRFAGGEQLAGSGEARIYNGYEWRATLDLEGETWRQVFAATSEGNELEGRMFLRNRDEWGIRVRAVHDDAPARLLAAYPGHLQRGTESEVTLLGSHLDDPEAIELASGIEVLSATVLDGDRIRLRIRADSDAEPGTYPIIYAGQASEAALVVYNAIDRVEVEPAYAVARVGGNGGSQPVVDAMFDAVGIDVGVDGVAGTTDDLRIGVLPATWSVEPWDQRAGDDRDVEFAGSMDPDSGVFHPGPAGPNPARQYETNNAGNLRIIAEVADEEQTLRGEGHLIVTVQRWNNPPIR